MLLKNRIKWLLIEVLGYGRFLVAVFHFRYTRERLARGRSEFASLARLIKPGHVVIDIGANIGYTTAVFSDAPSKVVYAFEPDPDNFRCLARTLRGRNNVVLIQGGVGASDCSGVLRSVVSGGVKQHALSRVEVCNDTQATSVSIHSVDSFRRNIDGVIGLVKIDVEGFEVEVLRGMTATVARDRPALYVEVCGEKALKAYGDFASQYGYSIYRWDGRRFSPIDGLPCSGNYLFAARSSWRSARP